jgi:hypothetical protein
VEDKMKKAVILLILVLLLIPSSYSCMTNAMKMDTSKNLTTTNLTYTFVFTQPTFDSIQAGGIRYTKVDIQDCIALGSQVGNPTLPVKFERLMLPPKTIVDSITVTGTPVAIQLAKVDLVANPIVPYQNEIPLNNAIPQQFTVNNDLYANSNPYPLENHGQYHIRYSHGYAIMDLSLNPVQYVPKSGQLFFFPEMTVTINLQYTGEINQFFRNNALDEQYVQSLVSNPEIATLYRGTSISHYPRNGLGSPRSHYDYVIVTTTQNGLDHWTTDDTLPYNWTNLIQAHEMEGLSCTEVTIEDINSNPAFWNDSYYPLFNDTPAHLREFCKDAYQNWGTQFVLIAGDSGPIPSRLMDYVYESDVDADIYFSNLDNNFNANHNSEWGEEDDLGFDPYAEIYIGRIPCEVPQDVSNWLTKTLYYANNVEPDYLDSAAFYAGDAGMGDQGAIDILNFGAIKTTTDWLGPDPDMYGPYPTWLGMQYGFETWNATNPMNTFNLSAKWSAVPSNESGWQGGNQSAAVTGLRNDINNNEVTFLCCFAHASQGMSCDVFASDWMSLYHNTQPFFIMDMGSHCGDFDAGNGVLDVMLFSSDTALAFACTYNTGYGWGSVYTTNCSSALQMKSFWDYFFDVTNNSHSLTEWQFGKGQAFSKDTMAPTLDWSLLGTWRGTIECNTFFGDPAQTLKTPHPNNPPWKPSTPVGPTLGACHVEYTYTTNTTDSERDPIYYLFMWGDDTDSGWLPTGIGKHRWDEPGTYNVMVKARDSWGACSQWSDPLTVVIEDDTPPSIPIITGPSSGRPGKSYSFTFSSDDLEGQNISFFIDWGDGSNSSWLGPYASNADIHESHIWNKKGTFTIKAKARDPLNAESEWGTLSVTMPLSNESPHFRFLEWLLEWFPHTFPLFHFYFPFFQIFQQ